MKVTESSEGIALLQGIRELLKVLVKANLRDVAETLIKDPAHKRLYELTGQHPVKELSRKTGFSVGKISGMWQEWERAGLVTKNGHQYRRCL